MTQTLAELSKKDLGFKTNKEIPIESVRALRIKRFRTLSAQEIKLGSQITVLVGRNGTMKTSLLGLIAHPFGSDSKDAFGGALKTAYSEVFKLSARYDTEPYEYDLLMKVEGKSQLLKEEVRIYYVGESTNRHRVVVSGNEKGDGNFVYNTSFLNLKRLLPIVNTNAKPDTSAVTALTKAEKTQQKQFYEYVFPSTDYTSFEPIHEKKTKTTFAPSGSTARYDYESISSGEDNLGAIFNRLLGFQRAHESGMGRGIFCIDEFECGMHPVAQRQLFKFLYRWSAQFKVQVVITTHSLNLVQHLYEDEKKYLGDGRVVVNFVSKSKAGEDKNYPILHNPSFKFAYKELTLQTPEEVARAKRIRVLCEDDVAIHYVKRLIKSRIVLDLVEFHSNLDKAKGNKGTPYSTLAKLCRSFPLLLDRAFVVFDADVGNDELKGIANKKIYLTLPDPEKLALERRIVCFILSCNNDDKFFAKFDKEKEAFLQEFTELNIPLTVKDVKDENKVKIDLCKRWANSDLMAFKQYVTYYVSTLDRGPFVEAFVDRVNAINKGSGLPIVAP